MTDTAAIATVSSDERHAAVRLDGEFDVATAATLRDAIEAHLDAGRHVLHLDMDGVTFMDSTAIGVLVAMHARCQDLHGSLVLTNVHGIVARVVEVTGLDQVLLIDGSDSD